MEEKIYWKCLYEDDIIELEDNMYFTQDNKLIYWTVRESKSACNYLDCRIKTQEKRTD